jgi:hypothetical protein
MRNEIEEQYASTASRRNGWNDASKRVRLNGYFFDTHQDLEMLVFHKRHWEEMAEYLFNIANPNNDAVFI